MSNAASLPPFPLSIPAQAALPLQAMQDGVQGSGSDTNAVALQLGHEGDPEHRFLSGVEEDLDVDETEEEVAK